MTIIDDPRVVQSERLWKLGVGRELGKASFEEYLKRIPKIPNELRDHDPNFPRLVLVETRVGLTKLCKLGAIGYMGNDRMYVPYDWRHADPKKPTWIRMQDGRKNRNRSVCDCRESFANHERGLTALEGVCAYLQHPGVVTDVSQGDAEHVMDLPGSVTDVFHHNAPFIQVRGGRARLDWDWTDGADRRCGSASCWWWRWRY